VEDNCDSCPNSKTGEVVNTQGCDPFQFCEPFYCGTSCYTADFVPLGGTSESTKFPQDCTIVIVEQGGQPSLPACYPTQCMD
jgi:hypothetical protein